MAVVDGYRLRVKTLEDLSRVVSSFRAESLRIFGRHYGRFVAAEVAKTIDLYTLGKTEKKAGSPLAAANEVCRASFRQQPKAEFDCEIEIYFVEGVILARVLKAHDDYRRAWVARPEVIKWSWSSGARPKNISEKSWKTRELCWRSALSGPPGIATGLRFKLVEGHPPAMTWSGIRRYLPGLEQRIQLVLPFVDGGGSQNPEDLSATKRRVALALPREITREMVLSYPALASTRSAELRKSEPSPARSTIDHADVVQSSDGRVFVAVPYVGLDVESRVFLQVADNHIAITQNATQYGFVADVPRAAVDLLRECKSVTIVEVEFRNGRRLLRAKHVSIVQDISLTENVSRSLGRWRAKGVAQSRKDGEIREWERE